MPRRAKAVTAPAPLSITATASGTHVAICPECQKPIRVKATARHLGRHANGMDLGHTTDIDLSAFEAHFEAEHG